MRQHGKGTSTRFEQPGAQVDLSNPDSKPGPSYATTPKRWCCKCQKDKQQKGGTTRLGMWFCVECK